MFERTFKNIDDVLWKEAGCSSELDYIEQASWMLFCTSSEIAPDSTNFDIASIMLFQVLYYVC